jgi:hypothetical protein
MFNCLRGGGTVVPNAVATEAASKRLSVLVGQNSSRFQFILFFSFILSFWEGTFVVRACYQGKTTISREFAMFK